MTTSTPSASGTAPTSVRALTARPIGLRRLRFRERVVLTMWFLPTLFVIAALVISSISIAIDDRVTIRSSWLPGMSAGAAESISSTITSGMLAFTAVVFSTTLVAIQLAGGQYSPRIVRVFVRSRLTHVALGTFLATAVFAINVLAHTRDGAAAHVPVISLTILYGFVFLTLLVFILFANGIVQLLRVQYLLRIVTTAGRRAITDQMRPDAEYREVPAPVPNADPELLRHGDRAGMLMSIDVAGLATLAATRDCWLEVLVQPGEYMAHGTPLARVHRSGSSAVTATELRDHMLVGPERTLVQDPGFALRQLVDVASRALSPAINDPTTASQAVGHIVDLLSTVATRPDVTGWYADAAGTARVRLPELGFARLATLGLTEIALYGAGAPQVNRRLRAAYDVLEAQLDDARREVIRGLRRQLDAAASGALPSAFTEIAAHPDRLGLG
jgi:uncharacterized membrane protein